MNLGPMLHLADSQLSGLLGLIHLILFVIALVSILAGRGSLGHKLIWTLVVLLLPLLGLILYFLFGRNAGDA